jgi:ribosomal protein S18 acetylase RimI-like enzyme
VLRGADGRARVRPWWNDPTVAQLTFIDQGNVPSSTALRVWLGDLRAHGFSSVRTGAVTDGGADVLRRQGFETLQTLRLLDLSLVGWRPPPGPALARTRRLRVGERAAAALVDRAAFGDRWAIDADGIDETCAATPSHRARTIDGGGEPATLAGYAVSGRADRTGYLQRLAVRPDAQGRGIGFNLTLDSLVWMQRKRLTRAIVNTHTDNTVALRLYERVGFRVLPQGLAVMARSLHDV